MRGFANLSANEVFLQKKVSVAVISWTQ